ncbi:glycosyltransferase family 4 protein [Calothrix sp. PCC 7507]|uniref:glycosyltransferase family 4 protein n=1 Tax=Calothrix sp. PCC 7507 TaxID=99598 RepID=UPI00029F30F6|nr:glycosyltransferase family 4 protein [Calothrix sp. PCC 7507]AFY35735.1 glycosyl transferase group 1 [Calothrix sp. PCC 7507]
MQYHIALSRKFNLEDIDQEAQAGKRPGHVMWNIGQLLGAKIYVPGGESILPSDKMNARIMGNPEQWALARKLSTQLGEDDVVFCAGEDIGIAIAKICSKLAKRPKIVIFNQNIERLRVYLALKLFRLRDKIDFFMTASPSQADFLRRYFSLPEDRICLFTEQPTDISFFTPGSASPHKRRPIIGSGGLEKRDYVTLAAATKDLDVDVNICAFSPDIKALSKSFPKVIPSNMSHRYYDWSDLKQLYRDSDVVAVSLFPNNYQAGQSTLFEAMACRRPVVVTQSPGIIQDLVNAGCAIGVDFGDAVGMKQAIISLLNDPEKAEAIAQRGYELVQKQYNHKNYIESFTAKLTSRYGSPSKTADLVNSSRT